MTKPLLAIGEDPTVTLRDTAQGKHARTKAGDPVLDLNPLDPESNLPLQRPVAHLIREDRISLRVPLNQPLSARQLLIAALLSEGYKVRDIAALLNIRERAVREHIERAGERIPGDLPTMGRIVAWYRGASLGVLTGRYVWDLHALPPQVAPLAPLLAEAVSSAQAAASRDDEMDARRELREDLRAERAPAGMPGASDDDPDDVLPEEPA